MIIAIDGPAGSGKGTLARSLAEHFNLSYIDSGLLYRSVAMRAGLNCGIEKILEAAKNIHRCDLSHSDLKTEEVGNYASQIATIPDVREVLNRYMRVLCDELPGVVIDGRDIGSVVCPHATIKFYVTARPDIRVSRRLKELKEAGRTESLAYEKLLQERDERDQNRKTAPLQVVPDAYVLDTSDLDAEDVLKKALFYMKQHVRGT